jgi:hypothetical protein
MSIFMRKRKKSVKLNNRWGSRRNRILFATALSLIASAAWLASSTPDVNQSQYLVANSNLSSSTPLTSSNLTPVGMSLGETQEQYLLASEENLTKWVLVHPVSVGELIPKSAVALASTSDCAQLVVALGVNMANTIKTGDSLDLWAADQSNALESIPVQIVEAGELVDSKTATDGFSQSAQSIEVCISVAEIRSVVSAIARKATIVAIRSQN